MPLAVLKASSLILRVRWPLLTKAREYHVEQKYGEKETHGCPQHAPEYVPIGVQPARDRRSRLLSLPDGALQARQSCADHCAVHMSLPDHKCAVPAGTGDPQSVRSL